MKWMATIIGFIYYRIPGAFIGFLIGSVIESLIKNSRIKFYSNISNKEVFELNLLALSAILIKADETIPGRSQAAPLESANE